MIVYFHFYPQNFHLSFPDVQNLGFRHLSIIYSNNREFSKNEISKFKMILFYI